MSLYAVPSDDEGSLSEKIGLSEVEMQKVATMLDRKFNVFSGQEFVDLLVSIGEVSDSRSACKIGGEMLRLGMIIKLPHSADVKSQKYLPDRPETEQIPSGSEDSQSRITQQPVRIHTIMSSLESNSTRFFSSDEVKYQVNKAVDRMSSCSKFEVELDEISNNKSWLRVLEEKSVVSLNDQTIKSENNSFISSPFPNSNMSNFESRELSLSNFEDDIGIIAKLQDMVVDKWNAKWLDNVHYLDRGAAQTDPLDYYDVVILGAGQGGLKCAKLLAAEGKSVALFEDKFLGGEEMNLNWIPKSCLIRSASAVKSIQGTAGRFGVEVNSEVDVDFDAVMRRVRRIRCEVSDDYSVKRLSMYPGIHVFMGKMPQFISKEAVLYRDHEIKFSKAVIDTGSLPVSGSQSGISGIQKTSYYTISTLWNLKSLPKRLIIVGSGSTGCEIAQAFSKLGSKVILLSKHPTILPKEDVDASHVIEGMLRRSRIEIIHNVRNIRVRRKKDLKNKQGPSIEVEMMSDNVQLLKEVDEIVLCLGSIPNITALNLDKAGIQARLAVGIDINDFLQTSNSNVYAIGTAVSSFSAPHVDEAMGKIVARNILSGNSILNYSCFSKEVIPIIIQTNPPVAHVGIFDSELRDRGIEVDYYLENFKDLHGALISGNRIGFIKVICRQDTDEILGAVIVGENAPELISVFTLAMNWKIGLSKADEVAHPYPSSTKTLQRVSAACRSHLKRPERFKCFRQRA